MRKIIGICAFIIFAVSVSCTTVDTEPDPVQQPEAQPEPVIQPEPAPLPEPEPEPEIEEFVVTEELYVETFEDIKTFVVNLNKVIASKDYNLWLTYLTEDYISYYSNPELLQNYSDRLKQRGHNIRIDNLEDYFLNLVVISRSNAVVDEIKFTDSEHITAYTIQKETASVLYYLEKIENEWKIGLEPEN